MNKKKAMFTVLRSIGFFCLFLLFEIITGAVRAYSVTIDVPIMFAKYALLVLFLVKKCKGDPQKTLIRLLVFWIILNVIIYTIDPILADDADIAAPLFTLPNMLSGLSGIFFGYFIAKRKINIGIKILLPVIVAIFSAWYIFGKGFDHWCQLLDGDTFSGKTAPTNVNLNWQVYNKNNDTFTSNAYEGKVVYLDFWATSCGVCFIKFPELEKLYQKYKTDNRVLIQAVNIPIERDTAGMAFYMIERSGKYSFPVVIGSDSMRNAFGVEAYPTVVILKDNKMVFRGRTELAKDALEDVLGE